MLSRSAVTKVEALFIIDVVILAAAAGSFLYLQTTGALAGVAPPKPAEFTVTDLTIAPFEAGIGEPISISANVTNIGDEEGNYTVNFAINNTSKQTQTVLLPGGNSSIVQFTDIENAEGTYLVAIADLNGTFAITNVAPPSTLKISDIIHIPYEGWVNENITITVKVSNVGSEPLSYSLPFKVKGVVVAVKAIQLSPGETQTINATVTETSEGTYPVNVGGLTGSFMIVPTGYHTLMVLRSGSGSKPMTFKLDGQSYPTPYSQLLPVGTHTIEVNAQVETSTAILGFLYWNDGDTSTTRTINLQGRTALVATYKILSGFACCPSLYVWNGTAYAYRTEVSSSTGYLPYFICFGENGTQVFGYTNPLDHVKLDNSQTKTKNGYYDLTLRQLWDEIFYLDLGKLLVVDHSPDVDVFSTMGTKKYNLEGQGTIYSVGKNPLKPTSALNAAGKDVLSQVSRLDGISTTGTQFQWNTLELNLGYLSGAKEIKLIVVGRAVWPPNEESGEWIGKFFTQPGVEPYPAQYMEVKAANGSWVRVPDGRQFPMLSVDDKEFVLNLTGLFPTNDYSLRINTFFDTRFDYIGVDTTPQQAMTIREVSLVSANLRQMFETSSTSSGAFTRFGDVTGLMRYSDDEFVIGRRGDEILLIFNAAEAGNVPSGMVRDYFFVASCWFKSPGLPYLSFTVDPIPFHAMSAFPYPATEHYPNDAAHLNYIREYNTRIIAAQVAQSAINVTLGETVVGLEVAGILITLAWIRERARWLRLPRPKRSTITPIHTLKERSHVDH